MRITWYGHASFLIETEGLRIILDPYKSPDSGGYAPIAAPADLVLLSHDNEVYHSHIGQIQKPFEVVRGLEIPHGDWQSHRGLEIHSVHVFETPRRRPEDEVTIIHFRAEGLHLVHLGDLGHALTDDEVAQLRGAEIVLVPAGGPPTIAFEEIPGLIEAIGPRVIIPMHYKTPKINLDIAPVERFLETLGDIQTERPGSSTVMFDQEHLPNEPKVVVLDYAR